MAATSASAAVVFNPVLSPKRNCSSLCSIRTRGLFCFNSLGLRSTRRSGIYGFRAVRRRPFALAEQQQQASQAEVQQVDEENNGADAEENTPQVNGAESTEVSQPVIEILLRDYREAVLGDDQATMSNIEAQLEVIQKEKDSLAQLVASLTEENSLTKDRLVRLNADFDNFRKRSAREKDSLRETVKGDIIESLLPMIDNFERAKGAIKAETEGEKKIDSSYQGIYKQFVDIMKSLGVKVIDTVGKEFNPEIHEAIMREESEEYKEGIIIQEFRRGFMLGDKLIRAAMVKVSSGKPDPTAKTEPAGDEPSDEPQATEADKRE